MSKMSKLTAQHKYQNGSIFLILPRNYTKVKGILESLIDVAFITS